MAFTWSNKPKGAGQISASTILEIRQNLDSLNNSYSCSSANGTVTCIATQGDCFATVYCPATTDCSVTQASDYSPNNGHCNYQDSSENHSENSNNNSFDDSSLCSWDYGTKDSTHYGWDT